MRPTFHPHLLNGPFGDPVVLVRMLGLGRNLFLDLGDLHGLPTRPVLKATLALVSHTHMDHFCGFDTVLRYCLGRRHTLRLVGPPGIADRVEAKLGGYTWNLVQHYEQAFALDVLEWGDSGGHLWAFACRDAFRRVDRGPVALPELPGGLRVVHTEAAFRVTAAALDHQVPSLAYALEEPVHVNVARDALDRLGLPPGPWLRGVKEALQRGAAAETPVLLPGARGATLATLLDTGAVRLTPGQKLAYVADCLWSAPGIGRACALARGAHLLYCEAAFLAEDAARARARHHLTAAQAGDLARRAGARELRIFHFSPKYRGREAELLAEAAACFGGPVTLGP